jgi:hypothetical protein
MDLIVPVTFIVLLGLLVCLFIHVSNIIYRFDIDDYLQIAFYGGREW